MKPIIVICVLGFLTFGCAHESTYDAQKRKPTKHVDVFRMGQKPSRPYKEIGVIHDDAREDEEDEVFKQFVKKAAKMGGDAIIETSHNQSGTEMVPFTLSHRITYLYKISVVVYE